MLILNTIKKYVYSLCIISYYQVCNYINTPGGGIKYTSGAPDLPPPPFLVGSVLLDL